MSENWSDVTGFERLYRVSNCGQVWNVRRRRLLRGTTTLQGYRAVRLSRPGEPTKSFLVHRLVARAFLGEPRPGQVVNHLNGRKTDNRAENLEWTTPRENSRHASRLGLLNRCRFPGERNPKARLTEDQVRELRILRGVGESFSSMARRFGVSAATIQRAAVGRTWKHVA